MAIGAPFRVQALGGLCWMNQVQMEQNDVEGKE